MFGGLGEVPKRTLVRRDLGVIRVGWVALHDTKLRFADSQLVNQIYGRGDWGFGFSAFRGLVEGILYCWDKIVFEVTNCMLDQRFIVIKGGQWVGGWCSVRGFDLCVCAHREQGEN